MEKQSIFRVFRIFSYVKKDPIIYPNLQIAIEILRCLCVPLGINPYLSSLNLSQLWIYAASKVVVVNNSKHMKENP